jgi:hypothetical protein
MPTRKRSSRREEKHDAVPVVKSSRAKRLRRVAQSTLFVAGVAASRLMAETDFAEMKLFSPGLVDRLQAPISRIHE